MNKITKLLSIIIIFILTALLNSDKIYASNNLDEIMEYNIQVDVREDGTLDINYHLVWKVLDDKEEGPLTWVKIGIPNKHVDEIKGLSDTIKSIKYYNDGGSYVRVDLDKEYYKDDIVAFNFSIHQSFMYRVNKNSNLCTFSFTPGWFDEIKVKNITLKWNKKDTIKADTTFIEDGYYVWNTSLNNGEKLKATITYSLDSLNVNENNQAFSSDVAGGITLFFIAIATVIGLSVWVVKKDDYRKHSGMGSSKRKPNSTIHRSGSCVHSCACACACACAGGGRAGCSTKDFYHTNLQTKVIKEVLEK